MNIMIAGYTDTKADRLDGLRNRECPLCGRVVFELDMESYYEEGTDGQLDCCNDCREEFEVDTESVLGADVIGSALFDVLWRWSQAKAQETLATSGQPFTAG